MGRGRGWRVTVKRGMGGGEAAAHGSQGEGERKSRWGMRRERHRKGRALHEGNTQRPSCCGPVASAFVDAALPAPSAGQLMLLNFEHAGTSDDSIMWHVSAAAGMKPTASEADAVVAAGTSVGEILIFAVDTSTGRAKYISTTTSGQHSITAMGSITDTSRGSTASDFMVRPAPDSPSLPSLPPFLSPSHENLSLTFPACLLE